MSIKIEVLPAYDRRSITNVLIGCFVLLILSVAYVGYVRPLRAAPFTLSVLSIPGIVGFLLSLTAILYFLACIVRNPRPDLVEIEDNQITFYRYSPRLVWLLVENWEHRLAIWDGDVHSASIDFSLRPYRATIERDEVVRFHGRIYGEGTMARLITTTGSYDIFPWGRDEDLIRVCEQVSLWQSNCTWRDIARDQIGSLRSTGFADLSLPPPSKLVRRIHFAMFAVVSVAVVALVYYWITEGILVDNTPALFLFAIAVIFWLVCLCLLRSPETLQLEKGKLLIIKPWGFGRKITCISSVSICAVKQRLISAADAPDICVIELATHEGVVEIRSHVLDSESTEFGTQLACHLAVPFYPSVRKQSNGRNIVWRDPDASNE